MKQKNKLFYNNQYAQVVYMLIKYKNTGFSMKEACDNLFFKMQSRLGELERSIGRSGHPRYNTLKIRRLKMEYKNMQGKSKHYLNYKSLAPMPYLKNLLEYLNKNGLK